MDLKDIIRDVYSNAAEAHAAFHAGHHEVAEKYLDKIGNDIEQYVSEKPLPAGDVTESATSESPAETAMEKPAAVPSDPAKAADQNPKPFARQNDPGQARE